jgi:AcrR family transcriptional regulator
MHLSVPLLAVASQPQSDSRASADDGGRSCIPLRDSPGFSPGSLSRCANVSHHSIPKREVAPSRKTFCSEHITSEWTIRDVTLVNMATASYHHGNLRQALLEHGVALARTGGPDAVVLRDVQRLAGVSNSAAYRHYADRQALLAAVQNYGMTHLGDAMLESLAKVSNRGPRAVRALARFRATGKAYIEFALTEPGLFRTAFAPGGPHPADETVDPERHPFQILSGCVDDLVATGVLTASRRDGLDEAAWAAVHGLSTLFLDGPLMAADAERKEQITDRLLDLIAEGVR